MGIGTLYWSDSTSRVFADFTSIPFHSASITHNRDKASEMSFKSPMKLNEADRIVYDDIKNNTKFGGQIIKRSKSLGEDYTYDVIDYTRLFQTKISCYYNNKRSDSIIKDLLKNNDLSNAGVSTGKVVHRYLKWENTSLWDIINQLAWLEYKAGYPIYCDIDYKGTLIWKPLSEMNEGYIFSEAYDYQETRDSSDIVTRGVYLNQNNPSEHVTALASQEMLAKWGRISEVASCTPSTESNSSTNYNNCGMAINTIYWNKCGVSPDGKTVVAVAKPSSGDARKYQYKLYRTVFQNYCPECKKSGYLRFDGGKKTKCITSQKDGWGYKPSVQAEHEITCVHCDADYCGVTGLEKSHSHSSRLKTVKKPVASSQTEFNKLTSAKLPYFTGTTTKCDTFNINKVSLKNEANIKKYNIASSVWKKAVEVTSIKNSQYQNARSIFNYIKNNIKYEGYSNTRYGAAGTLSKKRGNCVDHAHLMCAMCRSVGIKCNYIHNSCIHHVYNKVYINGKGVIVDTGRGSPSWGSHWGGSGCPSEKTTINF